MKVTALILSLLLLAAPASAAFLAQNLRLDENSLGHGIPAGAEQPKPRTATEFGLGLSETSGSVSCCAKPIEQFKVGDLVLSSPEDDPNGPVVAKRVEEVFERSSVLFDLHVGGKLIRTTAEHPFYVQGKGWTAAKSLASGDLLRSHDGQWLPVESTRNSGEVAPVYNLRVEEYHTYFVGSDEWGFSVWVHNSCIVAGEGIPDEPNLPETPGETVVPNPDNPSGLPPGEMPVEPPVTTPPVNDPNINHLKGIEQIPPEAGYLINKLWSWL